MNINATLLGQMITFSLFVAFTMKFIWPHIIKALADRQERIAEGLAAGERGKRELELSQERAIEELRNAKDEATKIVEQAYHRANQIVEEAKQEAQVKGLQLLEHARAEIILEVNKVKQELRQHVAAIAITGAEKILGRHIDTAANNDLLEDLIKEI